MTAPSSSFAARLRSLRRRARLTQQQLADASGLAAHTIYQLESGRREPLWTTVQALAGALRISTDRSRTDGRPGLTGG